VTIVQARGSDCSYDVVIGSGVLASAAARIAQIFPAKRCAIISDATVARLYAASLSDNLARERIQPSLIIVPPGENSKSLEQAGAVCDQMARAGLDRSSFVIALGGGVVGDLAGFVAAIYHRGIPWVNVPTTVLAQVDSCIGGKTGVNMAAGKNLIGSIHHPALVVADIDILRTLPEREWNEGFAEVIKHGIIRDAELFRGLAQASHLRPKQDASSALALKQLIQRNIEIKAEIVAVDERETTGQRALLNFGHTIGHAIERAAGYGQMAHGEAVALGIVAASEISVRKAGLADKERDEIVTMLQAFELPVRLPGDFAREKIATALRFDKKFANGEIRFVVTPKIGSAQVATDVTMADLEQAIAQL
jgi:3-dehydroquinate synthase